MATRWSFFLKKSRRHQKRASRLSLSESKQQKWKIRFVWNMLWGILEKKYIVWTWLLALYDKAAIFFRNLSYRSLLFIFQKQALKGRASKAWTSFFLHARLALLYCHGGVVCFFKITTSFTLWGLEGSTLLIARIGLTLTTLLCLIALALMIRSIIP